MDGRELKYDRDFYVRIWVDIGFITVRVHDVKVSVCCTWTDVVP